MEISESERLRLRSILIDTVLLIGRAIDDEETRRKELNGMELN